MIRIAGQLHFGSFVPVCFPSVIIYIRGFKLLTGWDEMSLCYPAPEILLAAAVAAMEGRTTQ